MIPPLLTSIVCVGLFVAHAWILLGHRQAMGTDPLDKPQDPLFTRFLQYLAFAGVLCAQIPAMLRRIQIAYEAWNPQSPLSRMGDFLSLPATDLTLIVGALIFVAGIALRVWSIRILGRLFTFEIGIRPEHKIIDSGPYSVIRHPSYTGYLLMLVGTAVAYATFFLMLGVLVGVLVFFALRINQEERMLRQHFGQAYVDYSRRTKRLIPYLY